MVHKLYERFLDDPEVYRACEQFWQQLTTSVALSTGSAQDWRSWIPRTYANGTPIGFPGNPIWDGRSDQLGRAYRIIQDGAEGDGIEIGAWLRSYDEEYTEMPRDELFIYLSLSVESANVAEALVGKWMTPETTPEEMEAFIAQILPSSSPSPDLAT
jgi:hypothetical protein